MFSQILSFSKEYIPIITIRKNNMILSFDFWVTTGSSTPIIPIKKGDLFPGSVKGLGSVSLKIS